MIHQVKLKLLTDSVACGIAGDENTKRAMTRIFSVLGFAVLVFCGSGCMTMTALSNARVETHTVIPPSSFQLSDIRDPDSLAKKLQAGSDAVSVFVTNSMGAYFLKQLAAYQPGKGDTNHIRDLLAGSLQFVIVTKDVYDSNRFQNVVLRPATEKLRKQNPSGEEARRLNRMLLEDAYPGEISRLPEEPIVTKTGDPALYTIIPITVAADIATLPFQVLGYAFLALAFSHYHGC
jgi:hypothetical protein